MYCQDCGHKLETSTCFNCGKSAVKNHPQVIVQQKSVSFVGIFSAFVFVFLVIGAIVGGISYYNYQKAQQNIFELEVKNNGEINVKLPTIETKTQPQRSNPQPEQLQPQISEEPENQTSSTEKQTQNLRYKPQKNALPLFDQTINVPSLNYYYKSFYIAEDSLVSGIFVAKGGKDDIQVFIVNQVGFENFKNNKEASTFYNSDGYITTAIINANLQPGNYFIVFNNREALITNKEVKVYLELLEN